MSREEIFYDAGGQFFRCLVRESVPPDIISYQLETLIRQKPDYLAPFHLGFRNGLSRLCYDISGLNSLSDCLRQENPGPDKLNRYISQIKQYLREASDYLLPGNQFSLDPEFIFLNEKQELKLVFWPVIFNEGTAQSVGESIKGLCELWEISCNDPDISQEPDQSAALQAGISLNRIFRLLTIRGNSWLVPALIHAGLIPLAIMFAVNGNYPGGMKIPGIIYVLALVIFDVFSLAKSIPDKFPEKLIRQISTFAEIFGSTGTSSQENTGQPTAVIPQDPEDYRVALLAEEVREHGNEGIRAFIMVAEFLVGRDMKKVDLHIADSGIGRIHTRIIRRAGTFFICDQGSKNGTYLDGRRLDKYVETALPDDCHIKFANREFHFQADSD